MPDITTTVREFLGNWSTDRNGVKAGCEALLSCMASLRGMTLACVHRPGISLSVRLLPAGNEAKICALLDIIDDDPEARWLSVCFDASLITDSQGRGDFVPQGLQGADACCFDYDEDDQDYLAYLKEKFTESALA